MNVRCYRSLIGFPRQSMFLLLSNSPFLCCFCISFPLSSSLNPFGTRGKTGIINMAILHKPETRLFGPTLRGEKEARTPPQDKPNRKKRRISFVFRPHFCFPPNSRMFHLTCARKKSSHLFTYRMWGKHTPDTYNQKREEEGAYHRYQFPLLLFSSPLKVCMSDVLVVVGILWRWYTVYKGNSTSDTSKGGNRKATGDKKKKEKWEFVLRFIRRKYSGKRDSEGVFLFCSLSSRKMF